MKAVLVPAFWICHVMIVGSKIAGTRKTPVDDSRAHDDHVKNSNVQLSCSEKLQPMQLSEFDIIVSKKFPIL